MGEALHICTSCKKCCFAVYKENTQVACKFNRLTAFQKAGASVIEAYDDEKEFFVVEGRVCNLFRDRAKPWAVSRHPREWMDCALKDISLRVVFLVEYNEDSTEELLEKTLQSCANQTHKPTRLVILYNRGGKKAVHLLKRMDAWISGQPWEIENFVAGFNQEQCVDSFVRKLVLPKCEHYYVSCAAGTVFDKEFLDRLDYAVNMELRQINAEKGDTYLVASINAHRSFPGYNLLDQLNSLARKEHTPEGGDNSAS